MAKIRMTDGDWSRNLWNRIRTILTGHEQRIEALEQGGGGGGGAVSGVKGDAESTYRTGNVNLTPENIGALPNSTTYVSGVKGNAESSYRSGQVNLTPANLGAQDDVGLYIDAQGYLCQRIGSDT